MGSVGDFLGIEVPPYAAPTVNRLKLRRKHGPHQVGTRPNPTNFGLSDHRGEALRTSLPSRHGNVGGTICIGWSAASGAERSRQLLARYGPGPRGITYNMHLSTRSQDALQVPASPLRANMLYSDPPSTPCSVPRTRPGRGQKLAPSHAIF